MATTNYQAETLQSSMEKNRLSIKQRLHFDRFFRGEDPVSGSLQLNQRRVFILPTPVGMAMVLTIVVLLLIAFVYNNNLVYLLGFLLASVFFISILHTYKTLAGLVVQAGFAQPVFAGDQAAFVIIVTNPDDEPRPALSASLETTVAFSLEARESRKIRLLATTKRRGRLMMNTVTIAGVYPLGIFRAWSPLRFDCKVLVYPKPSQLSLPFPIGGGTQSSRQRLANRTGRDEFNGIRGYQIGDSLRQIHWKAYAKGQGLYTKQYTADAGDAEMWLDYENTPGRGLEDRLSQLSRWVIDAEQAGFNYGLLMPDCKIAPDKGGEHCAECLKALALFQSPIQR